MQLSETSELDLLTWWDKNTVYKTIRQQAFDLGQQAFDLLSIPAMSAECERVLAFRGA